ncbi:hypothetical protein RDABS01_036657 [Bienertia sinuspersici]
MEWNFCFVYGAPVVGDRQRVWDKISTLLSRFPTTILLGDFNQVDSINDKLGGFTWTNATKESTFLLERLDKGYLTPEAFNIFPHVHITNFPISFSDHVPILLRLQPETQKRKRPYQIENWCLLNSSVKEQISTVWNFSIQGSPIFQLSVTDSCILAENMIVSNLTKAENSIQTINQGPTFLQHRQRVLDDVSLSLTYWHQRVK